MIHVCNYGTPISFICYKLCLQLLTVAKKKILNIENTKKNEKAKI